MANLTVEVADNPRSRAQGLMYRKVIEDGNGMLFLFDEPDHVYFHMQNTYVPLDIAFLDEEWTITQITAMEPLDERSVVSLCRAVAAIEVPQGWFAMNGVEIGDRASYDPERRSIGFSSPRLARSMPEWVDSPMRLPAADRLRLQGLGEYFDTPGVRMSVDEILESKPHYKDVEIGGWAVSPMFVARADGIIVGACTYGEYPGDGAPHIDNIVVDHAYRGRGIGKSLVDACVAKAKGEGHTSIIIHNNDNKPFWRSLGADYDRSVQQWRMRIASLQGTRNPWEMTEDEFIAAAPFVFDGVKFKYDARGKGTAIASYSVDNIYVYPGFWTLDEPARKQVVYHELGHAWESTISYADQVELVKSLGGFEEKFLHWSTPWGWYVGADEALADLYALKIVAPQEMRDKGVDMSRIGQLALHRAICPIHGETMPVLSAQAVEDWENATDEWCTQCRQKAAFAELDDPFEERLGACFELSYKYATEVHGDSDKGDVRLVHGSIQGGGHPRIAHAWVEFTDVGSNVRMGHDPVAGNTLPLDAHYAMYGSKKEREYTARDAMGWALSSGNYGPWEPLQYAYDSLTGRSRRMVGGHRTIWMSPDGEMMERGSMMKSATHGGKVKPGWAHIRIGDKYASIGMFDPFKNRERIDLALLLLTAGRDIDDSYPLYIDDHEEQVLASTVGQWLGKTAADPLRRSIKSPLTGTTVGIYNARDADLDETGGRWTLICEEHGEYINVDTMRLAVMWAEHPEDWCSRCQGVDKTAEFADYDYAVIIFSDVYGAPQVREDIFKMVEEDDKSLVMFIGDWDKVPSVEGMIEMHDRLAGLGPWMSTPGNHEVTWVDGEPDNLSEYERYVGPRNDWVFINGDLYVAVNSSFKYIKDEDKQWLTDTLKKHGKKVDRIFVMTHQPPVDTIPESENPEDHGLPVEDGEWLMDMMDAYGAEALFTSHQHGYEHYERNGVTYIGTAGGGSVPLDESDEEFHYVKMYVGDGIRFEKVPLYPRMEGVDVGV